MRYEAHLDRKCEKNFGHADQTKDDGMARSKFIGKP